MNRASLVDRAIRGRNWCRDHRMVVGIIAAAVFLVVLIPALNGYRHRHLHLHGGFLPVALAFAFPLILLNAVEFALISHLTGGRATRRQSLNISVGGSMANLLPIPGSVVLRTGALVTTGSSLSSALHAIVRVGLVWVGVSLTAFGGAAIGRDILVGSISLATGVVLTSACSWLVWRQARRAGPAGSMHPRLVVAAVLGVEIGTVAVESVRLWAVLHVIGFGADPLQGTALTAASVLTTASGIFPAGLGLREVLSAAFGAASGIPAIIAVTASVVDRLVVLASLGLFSSGMALWYRLSATRGSEPVPS
jgi:hypothetical protein